QGHVCCAGSRLLVAESGADELLEALRRRMAALRLGGALVKNTGISRVYSRAPLSKITEPAASGEADVCHRCAAPGDLHNRGIWFSPTVLTEVSQAHRSACEEIFGPVLSVLTFRTPDEAVQKANNSPFGLSAGVWTEKGSLILWMASRLRAGVVW